MAHLVALAPDSHAAVFVVSHTAGDSVVAYYLQDSQLCPRILKPNGPHAVKSEAPDMVQQVLMGVDLVRTADGTEIKFRSPFDVSQRMFLVSDVSGQPAAVSVLDGQLCRVDMIHADVTQKEETRVTLHARCAETGSPKTVEIILNLSMLPDWQQFL